MSHLGGNKCNLFVRIKNEIAATEVTLPVGEKFEAKKIGFTPMGNETKERKY